MLSVTLFGSLSVALGTGVAGAHAITLPTRQAALLAFLALGRGRYFSRWQIVQTLWGDSQDAMSLGPLNTALWRLRKAIEQAPAKVGDYLVTNRQGALGLNGPGEVWLDVDEFARLTRAGLGKPLPQLSPADICDLQAALLLYKGEFLTGFNDPWASVERERYRRLYLNALGRLTQIHAVRQDYLGAIDYSQAILDLDPLREDVHRDLMRYYVMQGQRTLALRQFELCRDNLRRELAVAPMRETLILYRRIADHADHAGRAAGETVECGTGPRPTAWPAGALAQAAGMIDDASLQRLAPSQHLETARRLLAEVDRQLLAYLNAQQSEAAPPD
ncbi:BTAD domain-containing putative transcriptional regulator [uncultured Thiodictyon sp.]|uniref:AfsR/SARP family transcriptional regulator n=1 Tax=uncultured Thiodictyon sp. TaxID=1846217 RepID=UPI0025EF2FCB|nr:BTAD domain-containing putative transcriptional regulator [uncultured Thiodictyon sp.]